MEYDWTTGVIGTKPAPYNYVMQGGEKPVIDVLTPYSGEKPMTAAQKAKIDSQWSEPVSKPKALARVTPKPFDPGENLSMPDVPAAKYKSEVAQQSDAEYANYKQGQMLLGGAQFFVEVMNANSAYNTAKGQAALNITQARIQGADAIYRGHQAAMDRQSEGKDAGQSALLAMAAQGQDVNGDQVQKIKGSYEAIGIYNGMKEEVNSVREALGYELEEVSTNSQLRSANTAKNYAMIGSALNLGAKAYAYS